MNRDTTYHFVGIKGSGMSALALILHEEGYKVQGSDVSKQFFTQIALDNLNIPIYEFNADNIKEGQTIIGKKMLMVGLVILILYVIGQVGIV